jgi:hypothetical protein
MSPVLIVVIVVVVLGIAIAAFGWDRYRGHSGTAEPSYRPTDEVFDDPKTGRRMRVWYDAATGRRDYRPE